MTSAEPPPCRPRRWLWPLLVLIALHGLLVWPGVALEARRPLVPEGERNRNLAYPGEAKDQDNYHLPVIRDMVRQWPRVNLRSYESATSPGYHLLLAGVARASGGVEHKLPMLIINALVGLGALIAVWFGCLRWVAPWPAVALAVPLLGSSYFLGACIWITTDNAALLLIALAMNCVLAERWTRTRGLLSGLFAFGAVAVRQVSIWLAAPVVLMGLLASPAAGIVERIVPELRTRTDRISPRWSNLLVGAGAAMMPIVLLGVLAWHWGGLIPASEAMRAKHGQGWNPAAIPFCLSLCAAYGVFFLGGAWGEIRRLTPRDAGLWIAGAIGLGCAVLFETGWELKTRDYGWLWRGLVKPCGDVAGRSVVLLVLAPCGAALLLLLHRAAVRRGRGLPATVLLLSLLGWLLAQSFNTMAWQRYFECTVLLGLAWLGAMATGAERSERSVSSLAPRWLGPLLLGALQLSAAGATLGREVARTMLP